MHTADPSSTPASRLSLYWATLRRRWRLVAAIVIAATLAGVAVSLLSAKSYEATAKVLVGQRSQVDALLGAPNNAPDPERELNTNLELISLEPVAAEVRRKLGLDASPSELLGRLSTAIDQNSNVVSITVRDASREQAARLANAFASGYRDFIARSSRASLEEAVASAREQAAQLPPGPDRDELNAEVSRLQAAGAFRTSGVQVVREATAASATPTASPIKTGFVAAVLGFVVAGIAIVVLARTDRTIRDEDELEAAFEEPILATVPGSVQPRSDRAGRDAFADLALTLGLPGRGGQSVVLVASPGPNEGTTAVTLGLARALCELGRSAIAIEADLRDPRFAGALDLEPSAGLVGILAEGRTLDDELVDLPMGIGAGVPAGDLELGARKPLPQALLASARMERLLATARRRADVVLVAGPPTAQSADSLALAPQVDAVLLVARLGATRRDEFQRARQAFQQLGVRLVGVVATAERPTRRGGMPAQRAAAVLQRQIPEPAGSPSNGSTHDPSEVIAR